MISIIGKFHPLIVHLPIGILLLNALFVFLSKFEKYSFLKSVLLIQLFLGMISALLACISGWVLAQNGGYDDTILQYHQWTGIALTIFTFLIFLLKKQENAAVWTVLTLLIAVGGHFGGTLTHGENYLFNIKNDTDKAFSNQNTLEKVAVTPDTKVYGEIIQPILKNKCYNCHNAAKQKGKLRLDNPDDILKGGENGMVVTAGKTEESNLYKRLILDINHDDHMPPKGKPQMTKDEIALIHWWITEGVSFDKSVKDLKQTDAIKTVFNNIGKKEIPKEDDAMIPAQAIEKADSKILDSLKKAGIVVLPVAQNSPYLSANFVSIFNIENKDIEKLLPIAKQLIWLKLGNSNISDSTLSTVGKLTNLTKLYLNNTKISDNGLKNLTELKQLKYLNLVNTEVSVAGLPPLSKLTNLKYLYIYKTQVKPTDYPQISALFPKTRIDTGGYHVPTFESDTTTLKRLK